MSQQKTDKFLKHLRKEKGLTQEQLAEHFYVSSRTVSRWETDSNMPDLDSLHSKGNHRSPQLTLKIIQICKLQ